METLRSREAELTRRLQAKDGLEIDASGDSIDQSVKSVMREAAGAELANARRDLDQVQSAIRRVTDGTYGECNICEEPISPKRLAALPYAVNCVQCAQNAENGRRGEVVGGTFYENI